MSQTNRLECDRLRERRKSSSPRDLQVRRCVEKQCSAEFCVRLRQEAKMAEKISFPLLNNGNYSTWKVRMEMLLTRDDYWFEVEDPKPEPATSAWKKANQKALATIVLFIEDSQMNLVKGAATARDAWLKLKAYHEKASMTSRVSLLKRICSLNLSERR